MYRVDTLKRQPLVPVSSPCELTTALTFEDFCQRNTMLQTRDQCPVCRTVQCEDRRSTHFSALHDSALAAPLRPSPARTSGRAVAQEVTFLPNRMGPEDECDDDESGDMKQNAYGGYADKHQIDSLALGLALGVRTRGTLQSHDASTRFSHTPLMLESQLEYANPVTNPVLDKASPLTGPFHAAKTKRTNTEDRRAWRSQSIGRSPPWAPSLNPYSMTAGKSEGQRDEAFLQNKVSPVAVLASVSLDDFAATVDGVFTCLCVYACVLTCLHAQESDLAALQDSFDFGMLERAPVKWGGSV